MTTMYQYRIMLLDCTLIEREVGSIDLPRTYSQLHSLLVKLAIRHIGGREGREWRIAQEPGCLVPLYVSGPTTCLYLK